MDKYQQMYQQNKDFKEYVDKYCNALRHRGITVDIVLQHKSIRNYADYLNNPGEKKDWVLGK